MEFREDFNGVIKVQNQEKRFKGKFGEEYELFKLACPHYDEIEAIAGTELKNYFSNSEQAIDRLALRRVSVIEIGCGPGYTTQELLKSNPNLVVSSVDNEPVMVEQAKKNLEEYISTGRLQIICEDASEFVQAVFPGSIDAIVSGFTMHNFNSDYRAKVMKGIRQATIRGGIFINVDKYAYDNPNAHNEALEWQLKQFGVYDSIGRTDLKEQWVKHYLEDNQPNKIMIEGKFKEQLQSLGFTDSKTVYRNHMDAVVVAHK